VANCIEKLQLDFCGVIWLKSSNFTWLVGLRCILQSLKKGWRFGICLCSIELFWGSGFGAVFMREALWWCSNEVHGSHEVGLWKNFKRGWGSFLAILDSRLVMAPKFDFDMMCGVGIKFSR
jgi:hypothetical protein